MERSIWKESEHLWIFLGISGIISNLLLYLITKSFIVYDCFVVFIFFYYKTSFCLQWWLIETFPWVQGTWAQRVLDKTMIPRCRKWLSSKRPKQINYDESLNKVSV